MENKQPKKPLGKENLPNEAQNRGNQQEKKTKEQQQVRDADKKNTNRTGENEISEELDII